MNWADAEHPEAQLPAVTLTVYGTTRTVIHYIGFWYKFPRPLPANYAEMIGLPPGTDLKWSEKNVPPNIKIPVSKKAHEEAKRRGYGLTPLKLTNAPTAHH